MGYSSGTTLDYAADSHGTAVAFSSLSDSTSCYRAVAGAKFAFNPAPVNVNVTVTPSTTVNPKKVNTP